MIGKNSQAYEEIEQNLHGLINGLVVSIDPSVGSSSSMPGWAVYRAGELLNSGVFVIPHKGADLPTRLRTLGLAMRKLYTEYPPDVLVYEQIPVQRHGGSAASHASLLKALGVILSVPGPTGYVGIMPVSWKAEARDTYTKGDEEDARELGWVAIQVANRIVSSIDKPSRKKSRKNG